MADSTESIKRYREILELDPGSRVFAMLAEQLSVSGEWKEAAEVLRKGLAFHPDHLGARMLLGRALMEIGDPEESERILVNAVEEIRKNSTIFQLLSELAAMSGKEQSSEEYARIYEAFRNARPAESRGSGQADPAHVSAGAKEPSLWDDFKAEAIEHLDADSHDDEENFPVGLKIGYQKILEHLAQRLDGRLTHIGAPVAILSDNDKDMLRERIVALLGA